MAVDIGEGVRSAGRTQQQTVALGVVAAIACSGHHFHLSAITVLAMSCRDAFRHYGAAGVLAQMYHLGAGVGLLIIVGQRHRVKFAHRVVAFEHAAGVFPGYGTAGFYLGPREFRIVAAAQASFGHEVIDTAIAVLIAGIPVLNGGILHFGAVFHYYLHYGGVQLVLVAHRGCAAFEIRHIRLVVGHYQRALKLACSAGIDAEIGG